MRNRLFPAQAETYLISLKEVQGADKKTNNKVLSRLMITIPKPYYATYDQFNGKFAEGAVNGVLAKIEPDRQDEEKAALVVTLTVSTPFSDSDKTFRETIATLTELSLRDKDKLINEYNQILSNYHLDSEFNTKYSAKDHCHPSSRGCVF